MNNVELNQMLSVYNFNKVTIDDDRSLYDNQVLIQYGLAVRLVDFDIQLVTGKESIQSINK